MICFLFRVLMMGYFPYLGFHGILSHLYLLFPLKLHIPNHVVLRISWIPRAAVIADWLFRRMPWYRSFWEMNFAASLALPSVHSLFFSSHWEFPIFVLLSAKSPRFSNMGLGFFSVQGCRNIIYERQRNMIFCTYTLCLSRLTASKGFELAARLTYMTGRWLFGILVKEIIKL